MTALSVRTLAVLAALMCFLDSAHAQPGAPSIDRTNRAVDGVPAAKRFWSLVASRRVDIALIGDSNSRVGAAGSGHEDAMGRALAARFGMYATRVEPGVSNGTLVQGVAGGTLAPFVGSGSLPEADAVAFTGGPFPGSYAALPEGVAMSPSYNTGLLVLPSGPLDAAAPLRFHASILTVPSDPPAFVNLTAREAWPGDGAHNFAALPRTNLIATEPSIVDAALDVPAGPRPATGVNFCLGNMAEWRGAAGPLALLWQRVERPDRAAGIAYSPLWEEGGRSARYTLQTLLAQDIQAPLAEWFRQITRLQTHPPVLLVHILHGGNDCNDFNPSLGPIGGMDSSSSAGHEDNIRGIIAFLRSSWTATGRDEANLFFQLGPYHPRPEHATQLGFEQAWRTIAASDPQVFSVAGNMMSTPGEFAGRGFLLNGNDPYHLSHNGFAAWAAATVRTLDAAVCPADFTHDGAVDVPDIFSFLSAWFGSDPAADFNLSGGLEVQDIFDYLGGWFNGC